MSHPLLRAVALTALSILIVACSESSDQRTDAARDWSLADLYTLFAQQPEADLGVDAVALGDSGLTPLLNVDRVAEPAIKRLAAQVFAMTDGFDAGSELRRMVFAQLDAARPEYLLLGDTHSNSIASLYAEMPLTPAGRYREIDLYRHPYLKTGVAMLPGALLAIGSESTLRQLIDRLLKESAPGEPVRTIDSRPIQVNLSLPGYPGKELPLTIRQASEVTGGFELKEAVLVGDFTFSHERAADYVARFNELAGDSSAIALEAAGEHAMLLPVESPVDRDAARIPCHRMWSDVEVGVVVGEPDRTESVPVHPVGAQSHRL
jgi:hypothetical protein